MIEDVQKKRPASGCKGYVHVIKEGDTLYKLARQYDVRLFDIMRLNPYVNVYNLQIGDEICIPTMPAQPDKIYVVNEGDTIGQVLERLDVGFDALARWNPTLLEVELPEGLVLKRPVIQPREQSEES
ncbi:MAG: LysM peptidoglycan-binding domain-containing protein [Clostridiales bacterium]|nr:LysM peptidoglycan-binding domain-containing protein [Clostridiales bacterium]